MKSILWGLPLTALLATGCGPEFLRPDPSMMPAFRTEEKSGPVTADQINEKNAAEIGRRLNEEIQKDEQTSRGSAMDRSKLAIP